MKKLIAIFLITLVIPHMLYATTTVGLVERWGLGAVWEGTKRVVPILATTTGDVVGSKWWKVGFSWASLAIMAGCIGWETYKAMGGNPSADIAAWLAKVGLRWSGEQGQKLSGTTYQPRAGTATATSVAAFKAWLKANYVPNSQSQLMYFYTSPALSTAAQNAADHTGEVWITAGEQPGATGFACTGTYARTSDWRTRSWCYSTIPADYETAENWENRTNTQMESDIATAWNATTGDAIDKKAWEDLETDVIVPAVNADPYGAVMTKVNPATGESLRKEMTDAVEAAINDDAIKEENSPEGTLRELLKAIMALPNTIATAITKAISNLFGFGETVPSAPDESDSQETIIGQSGLDTMTNAEKAKTTGFLDDIWDSVDGVRNEVDAKLGALLNINGACSLMSGNVWGSTISIDYCSIDYSALRAIMLAIAAICACLIVMGIL